VVVEKFTGWMKRRVGGGLKDGRVAVGVGVSVTIHDEFTAEEKSPCIWLL